MSGGRVAELSLLYVGHRHILSTILSGLENLSFSFKVESVIGFGTGSALIKVWHLFFDCWMIHQCTLMPFPSVLYLEIAVASNLTPPN